MKIYTQNVGFFAKRKIKKVLSCALDILEEDKDCPSVSIVFVSPEEIRKLNKEKREIDSVTDVLSFPFYDKDKKDKIDSFEKDEYGEGYLGDIAICTERAKEQAKEYGHSYSRELCFLALHGFLHLLGYDHIEEDERAEMETLAEKILTACGVTRDA